MAGKTKNGEATRFRTGAEQAETARKGGKASGKKRRERKELKETLLMMLAEGDTQDNITLALISEAMKGNVKAYETIRDTIGEKPVDKVEMDTTIDIVVDIDED